MPRIFLVSYRSKIKIGLTLVLLVGCGLLVRTLSSSAWASMKKVGPPYPSLQPAPERLEAELITIRPTGFDPAEIKPARGRFILVINNRSEIQDLDLSLDRDFGAKQAGVRLPKGRLGWKKIVDLPPGSYILTEAKHPDWVCRITITSK